MQSNEERGVTENYLKDSQRTQKKMFALHDRRQRAIVKLDFVRGAVPPPGVDTVFAGAVTC
jgi:hypothetical protein